MTVQEWIEQDRQWPRHCRIAHARMQLNRATADAAKDFWLAVLKANQF